MTPNNREELVKLIADHLDWNNGAPMTVAGDLVALLNRAGIDLVPIVATEEMVRAYDDNSGKRGCYDGLMGGDAHDALLSASPFRKDGV